MIPSLAPLFQGAFASYAPMLRLAAAGEPALPLVALFEPDALRRQLHRFRPDLQGEDERALLSIWSKYYFLYLVPPVLGANLILQRSLPIHPSAMHLELNQEGLPSCFVLEHEGASVPVGAHPLTRFEPLIRENMETVISGWQQALGLSPRVLWSNASRYIRWFLGELEKASLPAMMWQPGKAILECETFADGSANPLAGAYRERLNQNTGDAMIVRRTCCIRFRLPDMPLCEDCPRLCKKGQMAQAPTVARQSS
ncbi:siderophore-iron reductase FhuF [uncultured Alcanivorax sp.]|uniref:siderophore-iron reductase FhuF n=1 Tax=uncultured Alcanivorax sp. TaxID=191215 RepID=UPI0032B0F918